MNLGEKIKECRKQAGLSQEQLAERLNVSRQAITKWETNKGIPDIANLIAISDEFGLSLDELIKDDGAAKQILKRILDIFSSFNIILLKKLLNDVSFSFCHYYFVYRFLFSSCHNKGLL